MPEDFCQLSSLMEMILYSCSVLEELPHGFQLLPALIVLKLISCCLVNLTSEFGELTCLEVVAFGGIAFVQSSRWIWKAPKTKEFINRMVFQIGKTAPTFKNYSLLREVTFIRCPLLESAAMDKTVSSKNCHYVDIWDSTNLKGQRQEMKEKEKHRKALYTSGTLNLVEKQHTARVSLLYGPCIEVE